MKDSTQIKRIIDDVEPLLVVSLGKQEYKIYQPEDLTEKYYILFLEARADLLDVVTNFQTFDAEGVPLPTSPAAASRMEAQMLPAARRYVECFLQVPTDSLTKQLKPKVVMEIYNLIDNALLEAQTLKLSESVEDEEDMLAEGGKEEAVESLELTETSSEITSET